LAGTYHIWKWLQSLRVPAFLEW